MKLRKLIGVIILLVFLLYITGTYVAYADKTALMEERGVWTVEFEGKVYFIGGELYAVITMLDAKYDSTPEIPDYSDYLWSQFDPEENQYVDVPYNNTLVKAMIEVRVTEGDLEERTLLKEEIDIPYLWAGGDMDSDGLIYSFSYQLGPYVAYYEYSPVKIEASIGLDIGTTISETSYLTIPDMSEA